MKRTLVFMLPAIALWLHTSQAFGQDDVTIVAPASEAAEGLDLQAVADLFKESENLEAFEKALNDSGSGINNLDLNEDGEVDYIRLVEEVADDTHIIILQAALGKDEFQDVATIEVEKAGEENYNMQVHGNDEIYGADYYVAPTVVHVHTWPIIPWMFRPHYRPFRSAFYFGFYPNWWRPFRPVPVHVYHTRTVHHRTRATFSVTRTTRVHTVAKVNYRPRSSTMVTRKVTVKKTGKGGGTKTVTRKTTVKRTPKKEGRRQR